MPFDRTLDEAFNGTFDRTCSRGDASTVGASVEGAVFFLGASQGPANGAAVGLWINDVN